MLSSATEVAHTYSHQGLLGNKIADALAKAAANGMTRPEEAAPWCRGLLDQWEDGHQRTKSLAPRKQVTKPFFFCADKNMERHSLN